MTTIIDEIKKLISKEEQPAEVAVDVPAQPSAEDIQTAIRDAVREALGEQAAQQADPQERAETETTNVVAEEAPPAAEAPPAPDLKEMVREAIREIVPADAATRPAGQNVQPEMMTVDRINSMSPSEFNTFANNPANDRVLTEWLRGQSQREALRG